MEKGRRVNLGSELQYLTIAWSSDVGSSGCGNPPLSVSNKAFTRNRVANILQSTWNYHNTYATGFLSWYPILSWLTLPYMAPGINPRFGFSPLKTITCMESSARVFLFFGLFFWWDLLYSFVLTSFVNQPAFLRLFTPFFFFLAVDSVRLDRRCMREHL